MHYKAQKRFPLVMAFGLWCLMGTMATLAHAKAASANNAKQEAREHFRRGNDYQDREDYIHAAEEYEAAYKLSPNTAMLFNLGTVYRLKGDRKLAIDYYQRYLNEAPNEETSEEARKYLQQLTEEQAAEERKKEESQKPKGIPQSPTPTPLPIANITKSPPPPADTARKRRHWGLIGGGIGVAVAGGVITGVLVGTANQVPRSDGTVTVP